MLIPKRLSFVAALALFVIVAQILNAQAPAEVPVPQDQPAHIGEFLFPPVHEGARRLTVRAYDPPALGHSVGYRKGEVTATIYVYDAGKKAVPDDPDNPVVFSELRSTTVETMGFWKNAEIEKGFSLVDDRKRKRMNCVWFTYAGPAGGVICLGGAKNKFIKFRSSTRRTPSSFRDSAEFAKSWIKVFWPPT
jgi:hypothetical protein